MSALVVLSPYNIVRIIELSDLGTSLYPNVSAWYDILVISGGNVSIIFNEVGVISLFENPLFVIKVEKSFTL